MQLLAKDPDARVQTAAEVVRRIDELRPIASGPFSSGQALTPSPMSAPASAAAKSVQYSDTVLSVASPDLARVQARTLARAPSTLVSSIFDRAPILAKNLDLGGQPVPVWALALTGAVMLVLAGAVIGVLVLSSVSGPSPSPSGSTLAGGTTAEGPPVDLALAEAGDRNALNTLNSRPEASRSAAEWRALGRGYAKLSLGDASLGAFKKALALEPGLAKDRPLILDVRRLALDAKHTARALDLALAALGATGADIAYDVYSTTRSNKDAADVNKIAKTYVDGSNIRAKASPALLVALDLSKSRGCTELRGVMSRARASADARSLSKLRALTVRRGCGFLRMGDCYSCLRTNDDLSEAIKTADSHPAPSFT